MISPPTDWTKLRLPRQLSVERLHIRSGISVRFIRAFERDPHSVPDWVAAALRPHYVEMLFVLRELITTHPVLLRGKLSAGRSGDVA